MTIYYLKLVILSKMNDSPLLEILIDLPIQIRDTPHQKMLLDNHIDANKGKIKGYLYLEDVFGFCPTFKRVTKTLGLHLMLKTTDLQDFIYTSMDDDKNVTNNNLYLHVPNLIPSVETQLMFNEATHKSSKISYEEWYTERRIISDMMAQADIGSVEVSSPRFLIGAHQTKLRTQSLLRKKLI